MNWSENTFDCPRACWHRFVVVVVVVGHHLSPSSGKQCGQQKKNKQMSSLGIINEFSFIEFISRREKEKRWDGRGRLKKKSETETEKSLWLFKHPSTFVWCLLVYIFDQDTC